MLNDLFYSTPQVSPLAVKVASRGGLHRLVASMYGFENMTEKEASYIIANRFANERNNIKTAMNDASDAVAVISGNTKIAAHLWHPEGITPEAWNFMRVEKVGKLLDIAEIANALGNAKLASAAIKEHDRLAVMAFDYFNDYSKKLASDLENTKIASKAEATKGLLKTMWEHPTVQEYAPTAIKGLLGGTTAALGAGAVMKHYGNDMIDHAADKAKSTALETALGTAGVALGANQLDNLMSRATKQSSLNPVMKIACHYLANEVLPEGEAKLQNKVAGTHALLELCEQETPMFEQDLIGKL